MTTGYSPGIPGETISQIKELIKEIKGKDLSSKEISQHIFSTMGKIRMDTDGINIIGDFGRMGLDSDEFKAATEAFLNLIDFLPELKGKEFIVKRGDDINKIRLGLIPKKCPATHMDANDDRFPMVEFDADKSDSESMLGIVAKHFSQRIANGPDTKEPGFKIHRIEEFAGWFKTWNEFSSMIMVGIPILSLTKMRTVKRISASIPAFLSDVLNRCGEG
ncbi:MAG: hypothetical protein GY864_11150, partial [Desulfobacterales bacterium]|nr:hypothetical protein [Desulfobacterales bacterium]